MNALALINEKSGTVQTLGVEAIRSDIEAACDKKNITVSIQIGDFRDLVRAAEKAVSDSVDLIICAGGDGTQATISSALMESETALVPLPCGTVNMFCRDLMIPLEIPEALSACLNGSHRKIDVGQINDRTFINNVVFGAYADLAEAREELRDAESLDDLSFSIVSATNAVFHAEPIKFRATMDGKMIDIETNTIMVSNNEITASENLIPNRSRLDAGQLSVYLADSKHGGDFTAIMADFIGGSADESAKIQRYTCREIEISSPSSRLAYTIDGDPIETDEPVSARIHPRALKVLSPNKL